MNKTALIFQSNSKNSKDILYILNVPVRNASRMLQIELWINSAEVLGELEKKLGVQKLDRPDNSKGYVV